MVPVTPMVPAEPLFPVLYSRLLFQRPTGGIGGYLIISGSRVDPERISAYQT